MSYRFGADEPVRAALLRCAREELDQAVAELSQGIKDDPIRAVHNARKAIKKERSLLRLARGAMSAEQRRRENNALRDAARDLSGARDADVMVATVDSLSDRFAGQLPATTFDAIREQLKSRASDGDRVSGSTVDARAIHELRAVRVRIDDWELARGGWKAIEAGLLRSYQRGRSAFARTRRTRSLGDLHAWRKRVKDLWYHLPLLRCAWRDPIGDAADQAPTLGVRLGDHLDLPLLAEGV